MLHGCKKHLLSLPNKQHWGYAQPITYMMSIDLKKLDQLGLAKDFQIEVISLDTNNDDILDVADLEAQFGQATATEFIDDLQRSVENNDRVSFDKIVNSLEPHAKQNFVKFFSDHLGRFKGYLKQANVNFDAAPVKLPEQCYDGIHECGDRLYVENRLNIIFELGIALYLDMEFNGTPSWLDSDNYSRTYLFIDGRSFDAPEQLAAQLYDVLDKNYFTAELNKNGKIKYNEYHEPKKIQGLEKLYGFNIRTDSSFSESDQAMLEQVLEKIEQALPNQLALVKTIAFHQSEERTSGVASPKESDIKFYGAFDAPSKKCEMSGNYSEDFCDYFTSNDMEAYLMAIVSHELGHIIETEEMKKAYQVFFPDNKTTQGERFAEDLRLFIMDGKVATTDGNMKSIPYADERLALMKDFVERIQAENQ